AGELVVHERLRVECTLPEESVHNLVEFRLIAIEETLKGFVSIHRRRATAEGVFCLFKRQHFSLPQPITRPVSSRPHISRARNSRRTAHAAACLSPACALR